METKFTPGPWYFKRIDNFERDMKTLKRDYSEHDGYVRENDGTWIITDADGQVARATFKGQAKRGQGYTAPDPKGMANARLIAAAPEMYAALQDFLEAQDSTAPRDLLTLAAIKASAALAKAGQS